MDSLSGSDPSRVPAVTISGDPLRIVADPAASYERIRDELVAALRADPDRYRGVHAHLDIGSRDLDLFDVRRLVHLVQEEFDVHVVGLRCAPASLRRYAERELKLRVQVEEPPVEAEAEAPEPAVAVEEECLQEVVPEALPGGEEPEAVPIPDDLPLTPGEQILTVRRTLRSGNVVRYAGDVIVFGDVNPGAEVVAGGSIVVLGALKGLAQAGTRGDEGSFILSFDLQPTQLRIGPRIAIRASADVGGRGPEIAFPSGGEIVIEPYRGRIPRSSTQRSGA